MIWVKVEDLIKHICGLPIMIIFAGAVVVARQNLTRELQRFGILEYLPGHFGLKRSIKTSLLVELRKKNEW